MFCIIDAKFEQVTQWHRVVVSNSNVAALVGKFVQPGHKVFVEGKLQYREYEKDGQKRLMTEVVVGGDGRVVLLNSQKEGKDNSQTTSTTSTSTSEATSYSRR